MRHGAAETLSAAVFSGMLKVEGLMQQRCGMFDTPGVPHPHQLSAHLDPEEVCARCVYLFVRCLVCRLVQNGSAALKRCVHAASTAWTLLRHAVTVGLSFNAE